MGTVDNAKEGRDYNPRWSGYLSILIMSVANFASAADAKSFENKGEWAMSVTFGCMTATLSLLIIIFDRTPQLQERFDFKEQLDGKLEGYVLAFFVFWWIVGVGLMTRAGGIAYTALNIYFSSWFALGMSLYTLNEWGAAKDVISFQEMTHLSATLSSWYALFLASLVTFGSAADVHRHLNSGDKADTAFAIAAGIISTIIAMCAILIHYKIIRCCNIKPGGMVELTTAILLNLWWMVGLGVLTENGGVAATITGTDRCDNYGVPGSNLYFSTWISFLSSMSITVKWKAAQALRFAQAQERKGDSKAPVENDEDAI